MKADDLFDFSFDGWNALIKTDGGANKGDDKADVLQRRNVHDEWYWILQKS